jgi:hypothetical protein
VSVEAAAEKERAILSVIVGVGGGRGGGHYALLVRSNCNDPFLNRNTH